jgi:hypothetical protein
MEHKNSGSASDVLDGILSRAILVICFNSTQANSLGTMLKLLGEFLSSVDPIVSIILLDVYANSCCLPLKCNLGFYGFNSSKTKLVLEIHVGTSSINKDGSSFVGQL